MQTTETHPPARTLVLVRTGASEVEICSSRTVRKPNFLRFSLQKSPMSIFEC